MTDASPRPTADEALERGRAAVERGAQGAREVIADVRESSSFDDAVRSIGRRVRTLRREQPVVFAVGLAVSAIVLAGLVARAQR